MTVTELIQMISNVGFPIAMCLFLIITQSKEKVRQDEKDKTTNDIINKFSLNIQENTILLRQIQETINGGSKNETDK